jgi:hypothetical protein
MTHQPITRDAQITLDAETVINIRNMLLVGLSAYGELMRLENAVGIQKIRGIEIDPSLEPVDVTGDPETVSNFADALRLLG